MSRRVAANWGLHYRRRVRSWMWSGLLLMAACGRSQLPLVVAGASAAPGGWAGEPAAVGGKGDLATQACATPAAPVAFPAGCAETLCKCAREAFTHCDWNCWARVACQVATCNNNPARSECPEGCANATPAELELGHCYVTSGPCIAVLPGVPR